MTLRTPTNQISSTLTHVGIADGAKVPFASILALNSRTEIALGLVNDGCTSLALKTEAVSLAGQTWDVSVIRIAICYYIVMLILLKVGAASERTTDTYAYQTQKWTKY